MVSKWFLVLPLVLLTACAGKTPPITIKPPLIIPPQMLQCEDTGKRPTGDVIMESEVARYIANLEFSNKDCRTRLKEVSIIVKCYNDNKCDVNKLAEYMGLLSTEKTR